MAMEHANSFVQKFFEDEKFLKLVLEKRGFSRNENNTEEEENKKMVQVANEMGFKFDEEEYKKANMEYVNEIGGWETALRIFRIMKIAAKTAKEK